MAITMLGVGSGFDLGAVLDQIMAVERKPLDQIQARQAQIDNQISTLGRLKSNVSSLKTAISSLRYDYNIVNFSVGSSDSSVATATASSSAAETSYDLVVSNLAKAHKVASSSYTDANTAVGGGTLTISMGGNSFDIAVGATDTLSNIQTAINSSTNNIGVTASIINEAGGSRLVLNGKDTGAANAITFSVADNDGNNTDTSGLSRLFSYSATAGDGLAQVVTQAQDAAFTIDGFSMTSASNTVTDAVSGLSVDLLAEGSSKLNVAQDNGPLTDKLKAFVDAYNTVRATMDAARMGSFSNDSFVSSLDRSLSAMLNASGGTGQYTHLSQIGLSRDRYGKLSLDTARLDEVMSTDRNAVVSLLSDNTSGLASKIYSFADNMLTDEGLLGGRETSLNSTRSYLSTQAEQWQNRLDTIRKTYEEKFSKLDSIVSGLQGANGFLNYQQN